MAKTDYYRKLSISLRYNMKKLREIVNHSLGKEVNKTCVVNKLKIGNITYNNPGDVSNKMAAYFAPVGPNYAKDISAPTKDISDYLKRLKKNDHSIFLAPTNKMKLKTSLIIYLIKIALVLI